MPPTRKLPKKGFRSIKPEYALAFVALLGLVALVMKVRSKKMAAHPPARAADATTDSIQLLPQAATEVETKSSQAELNKARARLAMNEAIGLKSLPLTDKDGLLEIPFRLKPQKLWCRGGDIDTMKYASNDPSSDQILITLEPLNGGKGDFLRTSVVKLYKGFDHVFKVKKNADSRSYAVYLCSDSAKATSCKGKTLRSHAVVSDESAAAGAKAKKKDYIFYFQHLLLEDKSLVSYRMDDFSNGYRRLVGDFLKNQKGLNPSEVQEAWKTASLTRSLPPDVQGGRVSLALSYNDPRCMGLPGRGGR